MHRFALSLVLAGCWTTTSSSPPPMEPKPKIMELVQPVKIEKQEIEGVEGGEEGGDPCGVAGGVAGGVPGGMVGGVVGGVVGGQPTPPPPPPPPSPLQNIAPTTLEMNRLAGDKYIQPDDKTKIAITQSGKVRILGSFKLCVSELGDVTNVTMLKSTSFADYDQKLATEMRSTWRYRPYQVNGQAVPVCTAVTFIYSQS